MGMPWAAAIRYGTRPQTGNRYPSIAAPAHPCARGIPYILYIKKATRLSGLFVAAVGSLLGTRSVAWHGLVKNR
jgi:hypothetical protein